MITISEFNKDDYWQVKWPFVLLAISLSLAVAMFVGVKKLDNLATADLRTARNQLRDARDAVDKIEDEEASIVAYLDQYKQIQTDGVVNDEDRLQLIERFSRLRSEFNLFPVQLNVNEQTLLPLKYEKSPREPGRPISLRSSKVDFSLPLLHEDDLARLLGGLMKTPGLFQLTDCSIAANARNSGTALIYLAQHFRANCSLLWYTFALPPAIAEVAKK